MGHQKVLLQNNTTEQRFWSRSIYMGVKIGTNSLFPTMAKLERKAIMFYDK